jgi:glycosyltransferase involved in cell wall biosynthesis
MGRPCLVSTIDAGREVINAPETGLAADPDDPRQLADATCRLLGAAADWHTWSQAARRRYEAHFTAARFQDRLMDALGVA